MRFLSYFLLLTVMSSSPHLVHAADFSKKYVDVDMRSLTQFAADYNVLDFNNPKVFSEYLQTIECDIYNTVRDSQFKQQEIKQAMTKKMAAGKKEEHELFFRIPVTFLVSSYNFDTQSLALYPDSQMRKVNVFPLVSQRIPVCNDTVSDNLESIPSVYKVKLNFPVSLYRVPIQKNIAENIFAKLDKINLQGERRILYGNIYIQLDAIQPVLDRYNYTITATAFGQINAIDMFMDKDRKIMLKRLDYSAIF